MTMKYRKAPAWSMPKDRNKLEIILTPGPGAYLSNDFHSPSTPAFSIGKSIRAQKNQITVGPGSYTPTVHSSIKGTVFGSSPKSILSPNLTPGVGQYDIQVTPKGAKYTIKGRYKELSRSATPGPGQYNSLIFNAKRSITFTKEKKIKNPTNCSPGPGSYEYKPALDNKSVIFPKEKRKFLNISEVPGPGTYETLKTFSIKGKYFVRSGNNSPSPSNFAVPLRSASSYSIGKSKRFSAKDDPYRGPGAYETTASEHSPAAVFGKSKKNGNLILDDTPGPGQYNISEPIGDPSIFPLTIGKIKSPVRKGLFYMKKRGFPKTNQDLNKLSQSTSEGNTRKKAIVSS